MMRSYRRGVAAVKALLLAPMMAKPKRIIWIESSFSALVGGADRVDISALVFCFVNE